MAKIIDKSFYQKNQLKRLILLFISAILVLESSIIPIKTMNREELSYLKYGFPLHFIYQDQSHLNIDKFPCYIQLSSPLENPTKFNFLNFIISVLIIWILLTSDIYLCNNIKATKSLHK